MRSVKLGLVAAAMLLGSTALTAPAFAGSYGSHESDYDRDRDYDKDRDWDRDRDHDKERGKHAYNHGDKDHEKGRKDFERGRDGRNDYDKGDKGQNGKGGHNGSGGHDGYGSKGDTHNYVKGGEGGRGGKGGDGGDAKAYGGDAKAYGGDAKAYGGDARSKSKSESYSESESNAEADSHSKSEAEVSITENYERAPVNTAYAAGLSAGEDTCMGSSSIGAQAVSFGLSVGTTWQDDNCRRLKNSRQLVALGYHRAATALMCVDDDVRQAMIMAGTPCPDGSVVVAPVVHVAPPARSYAPMAPVADDRPKKKRKRVRKELPPK